MFEAKAAFHGQFGLDKSYFSSVVQSSEAFLRCPLILRNNYYFALQSPSQKDFAILDTRTTAVLESLTDLRPIRTEAVINIIDVNKSSISSKLNNKLVHFAVSINIYGSRGLSGDLGARLSKAKAFLQHPYVIGEGIKYENPHYFKQSDGDIDISLSVLPHSDSFSQNEAVCAEVTRVLDSLDNVTVEFDPRATENIRSTLLR